MGQFFVERIGPERILELPARESHHLVRVRGNGVGSELLLADREGRRVRARVIGFSGGVASIQILESLPMAARTGIEITCATAIPKGNRMDELVARLSEVGVARLVPLVFEHSIVRVPGAGKRERWERIAVETMKQCGRSVPLQVDDPRNLEEFLGGRTPGLLLLATPLRDAPPLLDLLTGRERDRNIDFLVGPEGGTTPREDEASTAAGALPVRIGGNVLRVETAAFAMAAAIVAACWDRAPERQHGDTHNGET